MSRKTHFIRTQFKSDIQKLYEDPAIEYVLLKQKEQDWFYGIIQVKEKKYPGQVRKILEPHGFTDIVFEKPVHMITEYENIKNSLTETDVVYHYGTFKRNSRPAAGIYKLDTDYNHSKLPPVKDVAQSIDHKSKHYVIKTAKQFKSEKFGWTDTTYQFKFHDPDVDVDFIREVERVHEIFEDFVTAVTKNMDEDDKVRCVLRAPQLDIPISLPFMAVQDFTPECLLSKIQKVVQSNQEFRLDSDLSINIINIHPPEEMKAMIQKKQRQRKRKFDHAPTSLAEAYAMCKPKDRPKVPKMDVFAPTINHFAEDEELTRNYLDEDGLSQEY